MHMTFDPAPTELATVLTSEWLSAMLQTRWPSTRVTQVTLVETLITQATKVRIHIDVDNAPGDMPLDLCIKGVLTRTDVPTSASVIETQFYRTLADRVPVRVPACVYAALNDAGDNGVVVMKDMIAAGATFLSALEPFTVDDARAMLDQLAALHAQGWQGKPLFAQAIAPRFLDQIGSRPIIPVETLQQIINGPRGEPLAPELKDAERLQDAVTALAGQIRARPACLVHGDAHAGNVFRSAAGLGLVDWQILQTGEWAQDVAYHLAAVLSPEDRRSYERELLRHYSDCLVAHGGPVLEPNDAWARYRAAMIYGYFLWSITRKVDPQITNEFVRRLGLAVGDLESFQAVGV